MNREQILAGALVVFCAVAAVGSWFTGQPTTEEKTAGGFDTKIFDGKGDIGLLNIEGMIVDSGQGGGFGGGGTVSAQNLLQAIERIREDDVPVVLLNINSPGGTASASDAIYQALVDLKRDKKTKIVASMGDLAASGGYYIACAADTIVANPATLTGSIGVIIHAQNFQGLMGKVGVTETSIKSGPNKDILSPYRPMRDDERKLLQGIVDETYGQFLTAVSAGRNMPMSQLRPLADGRIYTGSQALKVGLVDKLGHFLDAKAEARTLGKLPDTAETRDYGEENWKDFFNSVFAGASNPWAGALGAKQRLLASGAFEKVPLMLYE